MTRVLQAEEVRKTYREKRVRLDDNLGDGAREKEPKRRKTDGGLQKSFGIKVPPLLLAMQYSPPSIWNVSMGKVSCNTIGEWFGDINGLTEVSSRRVEEEMRIPVAEAMHASRSTTKRARKIDQAAKAAKIESSKPKPTGTSKPTPSTEVSTPNAPATPLLARKTEFDKRASTTRLNDIVQAPPSLTKLPRGVAAKRKARGPVPAQMEGVVSMAQKHRMEEERERAIKRYRELKELRTAA